MSLMYKHKPSCYRVNLYHHHYLVAEPYKFLIIIFILIVIGL